MALRCFKQFAPKRSLAKNSRIDTRGTWATFRNNYRFQVENKTEGRYQEPVDSWYLPLGTIPPSPSLPPSLPLPPSPSFQPYNPPWIMLPLVDFGSWSSWARAVFAHLMLARFFFAGFGFEELVVLRSMARRRSPKNATLLMLNSFRKGCKMAFQRKLDTKTALQNWDSPCFQPLGDPLLSPFRWFFKCP